MGDSCRDCNRSVTEDGVTILPITANVSFYPQSTDIVNAQATLEQLDSYSNEEKNKK
jgi:hypothetical protein